MKNITVFALLSIFALTGCDKTPTNGNTNIGSGTVIGNIGWWDEFGAPLQNFSGIKVTLEGTNISATSDSTGKWELTAPGGSYVALFSKEGYVTKKQHSFLVPVSGISYFSGPFEGPYGNYLFFLRVPDYLTAKDLALTPFEDTRTITGDSNGGVRDTIIMRNELSIFSMRTSAAKISKLGSSPLNAISYMYFSKNSDIDPVGKPNELVKFVGSPVSIQEGQEVVTSVPVTRSTLIKAGFHSGDKVFSMGFTTNFWLDFGYNYDPASLKYIPLNILSKNHTEVKSFILP